MRAVMRFHCDKKKIGRKTNKGRETAAAVVEVAVLRIRDFQTSQNVRRNNLGASEKSQKNHSSRNYVPKA